MKKKAKHFDEYTKKELLALPYRMLNAKDSSIYDHLLIFPTRQKHDSGWRCMAIIGIRNGKPIEKLTTGADDLNWKVAFSLHSLVADVRTDCCMKTGIFHWWGNGIAFEVGFPTSSIDITIIKK